MPWYVIPLRNRPGTGKHPLKGTGFRIRRQGRRPPYVPPLGEISAPVIDMPEETTNKYCELCGEEQPVIKTAPWQRDRCEVCSNAIAE